MGVNGNSDLHLGNGTGCRFRFESSGAFVNITSGNIPGGKCGTTLTTPTMLAYTQNTCSTGYIFKIPLTIGGGGSGTTCGSEYSTISDEIAFKVRIASGFAHATQEGYNNLEFVVSSDRNFDANTKYYYRFKTGHIPNNCN